MDGNWLDREFTFDDLDVDPALEDALMSGIKTDSDCDPDAEYIKAVAEGKYRHGMPGAAPDKALEPVLAAAMDDRFRLACFSQAYLDYKTSDFSETGYLKAVVENDGAKAAVIKDVMGIADA